MKGPIPSIAVLSSLLTMATFVQAQGGLPNKARQEAVIRLYEIEAMTHAQFQRPIGDKSSRLQFQQMLLENSNKHFNSPKARQDFVTATQNWTKSDSIEDFATLLKEINQAKAEHNPPFRGKLSEFSELLNKLVESGDSSQRSLLSEAAGNAAWISHNLEGVAVDALNSASQSRFRALFQLVADYALTRDNRLLRLLAIDLKIKQAHCRATGEKADRPTRFTTHTIDPQNQKLSNWIVYAMSLDGEVKRIGSASTPVTGELIPGDWVFFAEKDGVRSRGERHTVSHGRLDPIDILIRPRL